MKKSTGKIATSYLICFFLFVFIWFWCRTPNASGAPLGYLFGSFFMLTPIAGLICGVVIGLSGYKLVAWLYPFIFAGAAIFTNFAITSFSSLLVDVFLLILFSLVPALLGTLFGTLIFQAKNRKKEA